MTTLPRIFCLGLLVGLGFLGCEKAEIIEVHTIPAEPSPPESWGLDSPFGPEKSRFSISATNGMATVSLTVLQGDGGGLLDNVNRWRGQLGLEPLNETNLASGVQSVDSLGAEARLVDLNGTSNRTQLDTRLVGVIVSRNELTWFYKLMGTPAVVAAEKDEFLKYLPEWR
ncbi:MAG TPA: hypothetical protein EYQ62_11435 [Verrucomicrobiales bacterium]|nr:hypothetical protein [Verrucomicrobiales bacterium]